MRIAVMHQRQDLSVLISLKQRELPLPAYYPAAHPLDDPLLSPQAADLSGLPPMLIQAATGDPLLDDAHRLADRARSHGVDVRLERYPVAVHAFHFFWSFLPEAADAIQQAGRFARAEDA